MHPCGGICVQRGGIRVPSPLAGLTRAASDPAAVGGQYYGPDGFGEQRGHPKLVGMTASARDDEAANRLWTVSEDLTGVRYLDGPATSSS